jgi:uncharacterized protein
LAHFLYDALVIVVIYMHPEMVKDPNTTLVNPSQLGIMALISIGLTSLVVWQMAKGSKSRYDLVYKDDDVSKDEFSF